MTLVDDSRRVQRSAAVSMTLHGILFGLYLMLNAVKPEQADLILTEVDFVDKAALSEPAPAAAPGPKSVKDFLKMALPVLKAPSEPQEGPQDLPAFKEAAPLPKLPDVKLLVDKSGPLNRSASIQLKDAELPRSVSGTLSEVAAKPNPRAEIQLGEIENPKAISLEAVGRRASSAPSGAIRIDAAKTLARSGGFKDIAGPSGVPSGGAQAQAAPSGIQLKEDGAPARRGSAGGGSFSFGMPAKSGISLSERPVARGGGGLSAIPAARPRDEPKLTPAEVARAKGALDISGPLAGRKLIRARSPGYPDWAKEKGIEAEVLIRFFVAPDGTVLDRMILERTSGYPELDRLSMETLKNLLFVALPKGQQEDQWGIVTFRFRLK